MHKPLRILHAVSLMDRGGIETFLMNVYRNIDRSVIQFDFLDHTQKKGAYDDEIYALGGKIFKLNKLSRRYFVHYQKDLRLFFSNHPEYAIIHSHLNLLSAFTLKGAQAAGLPVRIAHSHSNGFLNKGLQKWIKLYAKTQINRYATERFACSKEAGVWQFGQTWWDSGAVTVIPNGINCDNFAFSPDIRQKMRKALSIGENTFVVCHAGKFKSVKNHAFLIRVFAAVKQQIPDSVLLLIGDGELQSAIQEEVQQRHLFDSVLFTGSVSNISDYLQAADCFVFPSLYEGLGISLVEAQAAGLPCVVADTISSDAILSDACQILSLDDSLETWAAAISTVHTHTGNRTVPDAVSRYDIRQTAEQLTRFYISCAEEY